MLFRSFKDGRYHVLRKLGSVPFIRVVPPSRPPCLSSFQPQMGSFFNCMARKGHNVSTLPLSASPRLLAHHALGLPFSYIVWGSSSHPAAHVHGARPRWLSVVSPLELFSLLRFFRSSVESHLVSVQCCTDCSANQAAVLPLRRGQCERCSDREWHTPRPDAIGIGDIPGAVVQWTDSSPW